MNTLGDEFPKAQERIRRLRDYGREIGVAGTFYVAVCDDLLRRADRAAIEGDTVAMIAIFKEMQEMKG